MVGVIVNALPAPPSPSHNFFNAAISEGHNKFVGVLDRVV
nr:MAG TPA: hypothetical protein [Caudoviricetes sp.]